MNEIRRDGLLQAELSRFSLLLSPSPNSPTINMVTLKLKKDSEKASEWTSLSALSKIKGKIVIWIHVLFEV